MDFLFEPAPTTRFLTTFLFSGIPSPLDIAFQRINGLNRELDITKQSQGGENVANLYLANKINHGTLLLQRGVVPVTPLTMVFDQVLSGGKIIYADVVILLLNHLSIPVCSWTLSNALPVSWQTCELDANAGTIAVNSLTLRYQNMRWLGIKA
jgi:phage tail-like protein